MSLMMSGGLFRLAPDRYYVQIAVAVPRYAVPSAAKDGVSLDVLGMVSDEQGRPLGRMRETLQFPPPASATLAGKQVLYQSGVTLPPGRFSVKVVVRENATGKVGPFEAPLTVPELKQASVKVSSVVLSTQIQPAGRGRTANPLVRDGVELVPNVTHVVGADRELFFYYEVYEPGVADGAPHLKTSLAFYRGKVKVFETPAIERSAVDVPDRKAALFQFEFRRARSRPALHLPDQHRNTFGR